MSNSGARAHPHKTLIWEAETVETLDYINGSNEPNQVRYSVAQLYTQRTFYSLPLVFPSPKIDLSVRVQTTSRAPFDFVISGVYNREKGTNEATENRAWEYRETYEGNRVNRQEQKA